VSVTGSLGSTLHTCVGAINNAGIEVASRRFFIAWRSTELNADLKFGKTPHLWNWSRWW
jgi:hypothetical protein